MAGGIKVPGWCEFPGSFFGVPASALNHALTAMLNCCCFTFIYLYYVLWFHSVWSYKVTKRSALHSCFNERAKARGQIWEMFRAHHYCRTTFKVLPSRFLLHPFSHRFHHITLTRQASIFSSILSLRPFFSSSLQSSDEPLEWPICHFTNQHNGIDWRSPRRPCPPDASPKWLRANDLHLPNTESSRLLNIMKRMKQSGKTVFFFFCPEMSQSRSFWSSLFRTETSRFF